MRLTHQSTTEKSGNVSKRQNQVLRQRDIEKMAAERTGIHKDIIKEAFNGIWDSICEGLENGCNIKLHGKGDFYLSKRSQRMGRNPSTGEKFEVPAREVMAFRTSSAYAKRLRKCRSQLSSK